MITFKGMWDKLYYTQYSSKQCEIITQSFFFFFFFLETNIQLKCVIVFNLSTRPINLLNSVPKQSLKLRKENIVVHSLHSLSLYGLNLGFILVGEGSVFLLGFQWCVNGL